MGWKEWQSSLVGLLFPGKKVCPICGQKKTEVYHKGICQNCASRILSISKMEIVCPRCGFFTAGETCPNCRYWSNALFQVGSVVPYEGVFREMIHDLKFNRKKENAYPLGYLMACRVKDLGIADIIEAVVPVPLYLGREIERGYNQSLLLAQVISEELKKPLWPNALTRKHFYQTQTVLGRKDRLENLKDAFEFADKEKKVRCVLLVDDIITTGATLVSCANVLEERGIKRIYGITWAAGYSVKMMEKLENII